MAQYRSRLAGTGSYLPKKQRSTYDLEKLVEINAHWIRKRLSKIQLRYFAVDGEFSSALALKAWLQALEVAQLSANPPLVMKLVATASPDQAMPNTANSVAAAMSATCTGFVYGRFLAADQFIYLQRVVQKYISSRRRGLASLCLAAQA